MCLFIENGGNEFLYRVSFIIFIFWFLGVFLRIILGELLFKRWVGDFSIFWGGGIYWFFFR